MTPGDLAESGAWMMLAWATGYCTGYLFKVIRRIFEVSGLGGD